MGKGGMRRLIFGMVCLGALIGLFVAWSASPIAMAALPFIFGLIGGASHFSVATMDVTQPDSASKLRLLGQNLAAFSLACVIGVVVGVLIRPKLNAFDAVDLTCPLDPAFALPLAALAVAAIRVSALSISAA
jgi:hypothetical protein